MDEEIIQVIPSKRVSEVQAKKSLRSANNERSYGNGAVASYIVAGSKIMDLFARYVEQEMKVPPKGGRNCRVQPDHVDLCFGRFYEAMRDFMDKEKKGDEKNE
tara:strand:- start:3719 stop:4027 length:309 start_codon:yes stop_codon:yes gene_type:complete